RAYHSQCSPSFLVDLGMFPYRLVGLAILRFEPFQRTALEVVARAPSCRPGQGWWLKVRLLKLKPDPVTTENVILRGEAEDAREVQTGLKARRGVGDREPGRNFQT